MVVDCPIPEWLDEDGSFPASLFHVTAHYRLAGGGGDQLGVVDVVCRSEWPRARLVLDWLVAHYAEEIRLTQLPLVLPAVGSLEARSSLSLFARSWELSASVGGPGATALQAFNAWLCGRALSRRRP